MHKAKKNKEMKISRFDCELEVEFENLLCADFCDNCGIAHELLVLKTPK